LIYENLTEFKGLPVTDWTGTADPGQFSRVAFRVRVDYDEANEGTTVVEKLAALIDAKGAEQMKSLIIGAWQGDDSQATSADLLDLLVSSHAKLPALRNLFVGDIISEENEISWIVQGNFSQLLKTYELLDHLTVRGSSGLSFGNLSHPCLKELIVQCGGLPAAVVHEITAAQLPKLEHLELWLGEPNYGGDATVEDVSPLFRADLFPKLRYLGLKNSEFQDDIASIIALAPVVQQLAVLDLSMGTLGDEGGRALLASPSIRKLKKLDLHHHFMSQEVMNQFKALVMEVDVSDQAKPHEWRGEQNRFISVSE
jgi:hypothetical protein